MAGPFLAFDNTFGGPNGTADLLPKPAAGRLPMLVTGGARQAPGWGAANASGWITYPRGGAGQARAVAGWRARPGGAGKPVVHPPYVDLANDADAPPVPIRLGFRSGLRPLIRYLREIEAAGVDHVALNLRFARAPVGEVLERLASDVLPAVHDGDIP